MKCPRFSNRVLESEILVSVNCDGYGSGTGGLRRCRRDGKLDHDVSSPQRQHRRYAHEAAIVLMTPGQEIAGRTRDVSRGGLCAILEEQLAVGTDIELDIQLVFDDDRQSEPLRIPARIVWCTSVDEHHHQVGVRFLPLTGETAEYLTMFLRYLDGEQRIEVNERAGSVDERFG